MLNDAQILKSLKGKTSETQMSMCQKPRYSIWGKCTQCVAKQGGDSCRFRDYRKFKWVISHLQVGLSSYATRIDPETAEILGPGRFESTDYDETMTSLPTTFNVPLQERHLSKTEVCHVEDLR